MGNVLDLLVILALKIHLSKNPMSRMILDLSNHKQEHSNQLLCKRHLPTIRISLSLQYPKSIEYG